MDIISPKYQMDLVKKINDRLFELFISYEDVANYIEKWHYIYEGYTNYTENFCIHFKDLLVKYPNVNVGYMGFPVGWENHPIWQNAK